MLASWCINYKLHYRRTYRRFLGCGVNIQLGCNRNEVSTRELVLSMFQRIDTSFDLVVIQSEKPMVMIKWVFFPAIYTSNRFNIIFPMMVS